jgi:hypothetical protein
MVLIADFLYGYPPSFPLDYRQKGRWCGLYVVFAAIAAEDGHVAMKQLPGSSVILYVDMVLALMAANK